MNSDPYVVTVNDMAGFENEEKYSRTVQLPKNYSKLAQGSSRSPHPSHSTLSGVGSIYQYRPSFTSKTDQFQVSTSISIAVSHDSTCAIAA